MPESRDEADTGAPVRLASTIAVAAVILACLAFVAIRRGLWYDELWSLFMSRADRLPGESLADRWLQDLHPPLFYALGWLTKPLTGNDVHLARLLNAVPLAIDALVFLTIARRHPAIRPFLTLFALLLATSPLFVRYFAEDRSYFTQYCAMAGIMAILYRIVADREGPARSDRFLAVLVAAQILLAFNLHFYGAAFSAAALGVAIILLWLGGHRRWATWITAATLVGGLILVATFLVQRSHMMAATQDFWAKASLFQAVGYFVAMLGGCAAVNVAALASGSLAVWRGRLQGLGTTPFIRLSGAMVVAALLTSLLLVTATGTTSPRYLVIVVPIGIALVAAAASRLDDQRFRRAILINAMLVLAGSTWWFSRAANWEAGADLVAARVAACPDSRVHILPWYQVDANHGTLLPSEADAIWFGHGLLASRRGFAVQPQSSRAMSLTCPTLIWLEHHFGQQPTPTQAAALVGLTVSADSLRTAQTTRTFSGSVTTLPPPRPITHRVQNGSNNGY